MKLKLTKPMYANVLGFYLSLAFAAMIFGPAPANAMILVVAVVTLNLLNLLLVLSKRISSDRQIFFYLVEFIALSAALPALICTWFAAELYWVGISYIIIYVVLRFGPDKIAFPRLRGEVIFWSGDY